MSTSLTRGLYEALLTEDLAAVVEDLASDLVPERTALRAAEVPDRVALHMARVVDRALAAVSDDKERLRLGVAVVRQLLNALGATVENSQLEPERLVDPAEVLRAVRVLRPDGTPEEIERPLIPLLDTTILTNAPGEPSVGSQVRAEIGSADRIDLAMAFIRRSGIAPLAEALRRHCSAGRPLRVLTTTYTGSTEPRALDLLRNLGAQIRVSYDTKSTRLHAKAWHLHRGSGHSTAYVGSSNLTHSAQVSGLEWNVRLSAARNPDAVASFRSRIRFCSNARLTGARTRRPESLTASPFAELTLPG